MGTSQTKATNKYKAKAYDRIELNVPKGKKDEIKEFAEKRGYSLNSFFNEAVDEKMSREQQ